MQTFTEIEAAIAKLPESQQWEIAKWLEQSLDNEETPCHGDRPRRRNAFVGNGTNRAARRGPPTDSKVVHHNIVMAP